MRGANTSMGHGSEMKSSVPPVKIIGSEPTQNWLRTGCAGGSESAGFDQNPAT